MSTRPSATALPGSRVGGALLILGLHSLMDDGVSDSTRVTTSCLSAKQICMGKIVDEQRKHSLL
jgi:hypothetical protein